MGQISKAEFYEVLGKTCAEIGVKTGIPVMDSIKNYVRNRFGAFDESDIEKYNLHQYEKLAQDRAKELGVEPGYKKEEFSKIMRAQNVEECRGTVGAFLAEDNGIQLKDSEIMMLYPQKNETTQKKQTDELAKTFLASNPLLALLLMILKAINNSSDKSVNEKVKDNMEIEAFAHEVQKSEEPQKAYTIDRTIPEDQLKEFHELGKSLREKGATTFDMLYDNIKEQERQQDRSQGIGMA